MKISHGYELTNHQVPVVRRLDPPDKSLSSGEVLTKTNHAIRWIVIYPVDSVIRLLNNPAQENINVRFHEEE